MLTCPDTCGGKIKRNDSPIMTGCQWRESPRFGKLGSIGIPLYLARDSDCVLRELLEGAMGNVHVHMPR